jgi:UPF0716 family protein affecting phage T7 exclusion
MGILRRNPRKTKGGGILQTPALLVALPFLVSLLDAGVVILLTKGIGGLPTFLIVSCTTTVGLILFVFHLKHVWPLLFAYMDNYPNETRNPEGREITNAEYRFEASMLTIAFVLILMPGFLTDGLAYLICIHPTRKALERYMFRNRIAGFHS